MTLSGNERKELCEALVDAFPNYENLEMMVSFNFNQNLHGIAGSGEIKNVAFKLIKWAERSGKLEDLIRGAWEENSGNPKLNAFYQTYQTIIAHKHRQSSITQSNYESASSPTAARGQTVESGEVERSRNQQPRVARPQTRNTNTTSSTPIDRRQFLKWVGFGSGGLAIVFIASQILNRQSTPQLTPFKFKTVKVNAKGERTEELNKQANYFKEGLGNGITLEMVEIPAGSFTMGSPADEEGRYEDEGPQRRVEVPGFFIGKYQVTQAQWKAVAALDKVNRDLKADPSNFKGDNRPVEKVNWYDAVEFCERLSNHTGRKYRLPSEAQWEYACRAGTTTPFHFGETITSELANYNANYIYGAGPKGKYREKTTPVGSFDVANAFGLYDMHGNVWEWCLDDWHDNYDGAPTDGSAWISENDNLSQAEGIAVLRGSSWFGFPNRCRSANRVNYGRSVGRGFISNLIGFRVVCAFGRASS